MKRQSDKQKKKKITQPLMKWQIGDYARPAAFRFYIPYQLLLLCKLTNITPETLLHDFMDTIDCGSWKREETTEKARQLLIDYFIERGYGKDFYTEQDIRKLFEELNAIGMLWPRDAKMKFIELHSKWRNKYHTYWFKKWFKKLRRKL